MAKRVAFLGCGKIGQAMLKHIQQNDLADLAFIQDPFFHSDDPAPCPVVDRPDAAMYDGVDLVIECATSSVLSENLEMILSHADLLMFSVTAFCDPAFEQRAYDLCQKHGHRIYFPHGAILGLDGIVDAKPIIQSVTIETTKNPKSFGRDDTEYTVLYEGPTREACKLYPRNVNVHAAVALAALGFDKTCSKMIADPSVNTNSHIIKVDGEGIHFEIHVSSFSTGGVTGLYTPLSACGSLDRILDGGDHKYTFL